MHASLIHEPEPSDSDYDTSNTNRHGNETDDSINDLYQSYNVIKDAKCSMQSRRAFNTITIKAHLEYEERFMGLTHNHHDRYITCDNGADTWVIGDGWTILEEDPIRTANLVAFDPDKMRKNGCPIVMVATTVKDAHGNFITIIV